MLSGYPRLKNIRGGFAYLIRNIFAKPSESENAHGIIVKSVWLLRIITFIFGLYQAFFGETLIGIMIILCVIFLIAPFVFTKGRIANIPLEIEFFLFIMVVFQFVLGEAHGFYSNIQNYDKVIHFFFPLLISIIGFTITYTLYFSGKLKVSVTAMIFIVIVFTLGIGAFWEIFEYGHDLFIAPRIENWGKFQGSDSKNALSDTMNDLIADLLGGIFGALIASKYVIEAKYNKRMREIFREITRDFINGPKTSKH